MKERECACQILMIEVFSGVPHIGHCNSRWALMVHSCVCVCSVSMSMFVLHWSVGEEIQQRTFAWAPLWPQASHRR